MQDGLITTFSRQLDGLSFEYLIPRDLEDIISERPSK